MKKHLLCCLCLSASTLAFSANVLPVGTSEPTGVKLLDESFAYEVGNLVGKGGWLDYKFNNLGGDPMIQVVDGALQYSGYQDNAVGRAIALQGKGGDAAIPFQSVNGTLYASMLVNVKNVNDSKNTIVAFGNGDTPDRSVHFGRIIATSEGDKVKFGIAQKSNIYDANGVQYSDVYDMNETMLLVVKYNQGPKSGDDYIELFINPTDIYGAEPQSTIKTNEVLSEPTSGLTFMKLVQNGTDVADYNIVIDDIRVATSWESLFDGSEVEQAPEIEVVGGSAINLGAFEQGGEPLVKTVNIKAKNLRSDLTVSAGTEGYYTLNTTTITKAQAESEQGFDLVITLNPQDRKVQGDLITISSALAKSAIALDWTYKAKQTGVKLLDESFAYEVGNLVGKGGWLDYKFNNLGGDPMIQVVDGALQYSGYQDNAVGRAIELQGKGGDAAIPFQSVNGTLYASMLVNVKNVNDSKNTIVAFGNGDTPDRSVHFGRIIATSEGDKVKFGIAQKSNIYDANGVQYSDVYDMNETMLLVVKYNQGPKSGDDYIELFINPTDIYGAEPQSTIKTNEVLSEPTSGLTFMKLVQNGTDVADYNIVIDDIRVATSWESLFDGSEVEQAPEIEIVGGSAINLGAFEQGGEPLVKTVNIKAKNLRSDLTVSAGTEGYYTLNTTTITKAQAESEQGFDLVITLNPQDRKVQGDLITISSALAKSAIALDWTYKAKQTGVKLLDESFAYEVGNLVGKGGWLDYKFNNLGGDPMIQVVDGALQYSGYQDNAVGRAIELQGKGGDAAIPFQSVNGTLYASMLVNVKNVNDSKNTIVAFGNGDTPDRSVHFGRIIATSEGDKVKFGIAQKSNIYDANGVQYSDVYDMNETMLLVVKYNQGPKSGDDYIELFINPTDIYGAEPQSTIKTNEVLSEPTSGLTFMKLVQNGTDVADYNIVIDDIRVATSWESLFDGSEVEQAPEIEVVGGSAINLGAFEQGGEPLVKTVNIKAKNLRSDLTVSAGTEGYYTLNTTTITKAQAESEQGFDLVITLNPQDRKVQGDLITISSALAKSAIALDWTYKAKQTGVKLLDESFAYEVGNLVGKGGWLDYKFNNLGGDPMIQVVDGALQYSGYQDNAVGRAIELQGKGGDAAIPFQSVNGTLYASMLVNVKNVNDSKNTIVAFGNGDTPDRSVHFGRIIATSEGDKVKFGIAQKSNIYDANGVQYSDVYDMNETMLLVVKYNQGPKSGDDYIELFINPTDIYGAEPQSTIKTNEVLSEPTSGLTFMKLVQNGTDVADYNIVIDDIRVATSWESLFDGSEVEQAPEIEVVGGSAINFGAFEQGGEPLVKTVNIKAKNLRSDLTVSAGTEGYYTLNTTTITKAQAESEQGFDLVITLNPQDDQVLNDLITFVGEFVNYPIFIEWNYNVSGIEKIADNKITGYVNGNFIAEGAQSICVYDLTGNCVLMTNGECLDMTELTRAVYLVRILDKTGLVHTVKIAK